MGLELSQLWFADMIETGQEKEMDEDHEEMRKNAIVNGASSPYLPNLIPMLDVNFGDYYKKNFIFIFLNCVLLAA